jgi:protein SCO1
MNSAIRKAMTRLQYVMPVVGTALLMFLLTGCNRNSELLSSALSVDRPDCLPNLILTDKFGNQVNLVSLRGKPILFDFFYTSCPGPCLVLTARMKKIADQIGQALGSQVTFVSVTVDPEHDHPTQLLAYAKEQGVDRKGWLFLTGTPNQIDQLMSRFKLRRQREADGSVDHVLEFFVVGADGHMLYQYLWDTNPTRIAGDLTAAENHIVANANDTVNRMSH